MTQRMDSSAAYFHGGVRKLKPGERILPPKNTGAHSNADYGAEGVCRRDLVYLTIDPQQAELYACMYPPASRGWIYEVEPLGDVEHDPDWLGEPGGSVCCPAARVLRVVAKNVTTFQGLTVRQVMNGLLTADGDQYASSVRFEAVTR